MNSDSPTLLAVSGLTTLLATTRGSVPVVEQVSFQINRGETFALVGESGCGKSVTALSILRLLDPGLSVAGGRVDFRGRNLLELSSRELRAVRGRQIAMIFQEPMTALNPVLTVGDQVREVLRLHLRMNSRAARQRCLELFSEVGIPDPEQRVDEYPHSLSGGLRQRVMIAMALACDPLLLIADEPTTALDVTVQAQILDLLARLQAEREMSILLITHDLGVVAELAQRVAVMYAGRIVESASASALFSEPAHPYTLGLFHSMPETGAPVRRLRSIPGVVPRPGEATEGCRFQPRCDEALEACSVQVPELRRRGATGWVACFAREAAAGEGAS